MGLGIVYLRCGLRLPCKASPQLGLRLRFAP